jgi:hypothetical protein
MVDHGIAAEGPVSRPIIPNKIRKRARSMRSLIEPFLGKPGKHGFHQFATNRASAIGVCFFPMTSIRRMQSIFSDISQGVRMPPRIALSLALFAASPLFAQTTEPIIHTADELQQREAKLLETAKANPTGIAISRLEDYGNDYTLLVVRVHTGDAERHQFFADQIVIKSGTITLVTGGTMQQEHTNSGPGRPGETVGSGIEGGKEVVLHAGDIAHIPAALPHWFKVAPGTTTTYLVFKEK